MVAELISQYAGADMDELRAVLRNPKATVLERIVCRVLMVSETKGNLGHFEFILNRSVGKVKDEVELTTPNPYEGWTLEQIQTERARIAQKNIETLRLIANSGQTLVPTQQPEAKQPEETPTNDSATPIDPTGPGPSSPTT
jgi:hypothetical protein